MKPAAGTVFRDRNKTAGARRGWKSRDFFRRLQTSAPFPATVLSDPFQGSAASSGYHWLP